MRTLVSVYLCLFASSVCILTMGCGDPQQEVDTRTASQGLGGDASSSPSSQPQLMIPANAHVMSGGEIPSEIRELRARTGANQQEEPAPNERSAALPNWRRPKHDSDKAQQRVIEMKSALGGPEILDSITRQAHPELSAVWRRRPPDLPAPTRSASRLGNAQQAYESWLEANPGASRAAKQAELARQYQQARRIP